MQSNPQQVSLHCILGTLHQGHEGDEQKYERHNNLG